LLHNELLRQLDPLEREPDLFAPGHGRRTFYSDAGSLTSDRREPEGGGCVAVLWLPSRHPSRQHRPAQSHGPFRLMIQCPGRSRHPSPRRSSDDLPFRDFESGLQAISRLSRVFVPCGTRTPEPSRGICIEEVGGGPSCQFCWIAVVRKKTLRSRSHEGILPGHFQKPRAAISSWLKGKGSQAAP
jgi:hypothetical protein